MTLSPTRNTLCILPLLIVAGCMFPPLTSCWDAYFVPKWYAATIGIIICGFIHQRKAIREVSASEWLSCLPRVAVMGILFQAGYVLLDWARHATLPPIGATGSFDVPAGLALTVCLLLPFVIYGLNLSTVDKKQVWLYRITVLIGIALVVLSQSRAGVLALCLTGVVCLVHSRIKRWLKVGIILALTVGTCLAVLTTKRDSSSGRAFIMEQTIHLIQEKPLWGHGFHGFSRVYMPRQQHYFDVHPDATTAQLADEIKHPLNEFLLAWVNYGVLGALLLLLGILLPLIVFRRHPLAWMVVGTLFIFCSLSYPLHYPITWIYLAIGAGAAIHRYLPFKVRRASLATGVSLAVCLLTALPCDIMLSRAHNYIQRVGHSRAIATYGECKELFSTFPFTWVYPFRCHQYLYNYTYELYSMGHLDEARQTATECLQYANSYNLQLLTGDICQMQQEYDSAITHYQNAAQMCPVRFAPLSGMLQTYRQTGDTIKADSIAQIILHKPVKVPSAEIDAMKEEAKRVKNEELKVRN